MCIQDYRDGKYKVANYNLILIDMKTLSKLLISLIFILFYNFSYCAQNNEDYSILKLKYDSVVKITDSLKYTQKNLQASNDSHEILSLVNTFYDNAGINY
jgi:hypothetical protein